MFKIKALHALLAGASVLTSASASAQDTTPPPANPPVNPVVTAASEEADQDGNAGDFELSKRF